MLSAELPFEPFGYEYAAYCPAMRRWQTRLALVATLGIVSLAGCTSDDGDVPVTVVLTWGSQLADAPSSFIVRVTSSGSGEEVSATALKAVPVDDDGLVLPEDELPPGRYRLYAEQRGCGMNGRDCPDDPSSDEYGPTSSWRCSVSFEARTGRPTRVEILEPPDPEATEQARCQVAV